MSRTGVGFHWLGLVGTWLTAIDVKVRDRVGNDRASTSPQRIAILRALVGLGDLLCAVPALRALRSAYPQAQIWLVGLPQAALLVERFTAYLDGWLEFPGFPGLPERSPQIDRIPKFLTAMQQQSFDLVLQMHGSGGITNPIVALWQARQLAGFFVPGQFCPNEASFLPFVESESEIRRYLRLLEHLGIPAQGEALEFPLWQTDRQEFSAIAQQHNLPPDRYICVHPGASVLARRWAPEQFAAVADRLAATGLQVVLTGSASETTLTQAVAAAMQAPAIDLAGQTSLGVLAVLLSQSRLLVCNDTGVSHLAAALQVPSVVIFSQSDPDRWAPLDRQRHRIVHQPSGATIEAVLAQSMDLLQPETAHVA